MTFKEEFPSLKDFEIDFNGLVNNGYEHKLIQLGVKKSMIYISKEIQKHCIDKQRVIEAIDKAYDNMYKYGEPEPDDYSGFRLEILKELKVKEK